MKAKPVAMTDVPHKTFLELLSATGKEPMYAHGQRYIVVSTSAGNVIVFERPTQGVFRIDE